MSSRSPEPESLEPQPVASDQTPFWRPLIFNGVPVITVAGLILAQARDVAPQAQIDPNQGKNKAATEPGVVPTLEAAGLQLVLPDPRDAQLSLTLNRAAALSAPALGGIPQRQGEPSPTATTVPMLVDGKMKDVEVYTPDRLKAEKIDPGHNPANFANHDIKECTAPQVLTEPEEGSFANNSLVSFVGQLIGPGKAEAAELYSPLEATSVQEKEAFLKCIKAVEAQRPVLTALGDNVKDWDLSNVAEYDTIENWRKNIAQEAKNRLFNLSQAEIDQLLGESLRSVFLSADGKTLTPFDAKIENLTEEELVAKYGPKHEGIHSSKEKVWVVFAGGKIRVIFGKCANVVVPVPQRPVVPAQPTVTPAYTVTPTATTEATKTPTQVTITTTGGPGPGASPTSPSTSTGPSATPTAPVIIVSPSPTPVPTARPTIPPQTTPLHTTTPSERPGPTDTPRPVDTRRPTETAAPGQPTVTQGPRVQPTIDQQHGVLPTTAPAVAPRPTDVPVAVVNRRPTESAPASQPAAQAATKPEANPAPRTQMNPDSAPAAAPAKPGQAAAVVEAPKPQAAAKPAEAAKPAAAPAPKDAPVAVSQQIAKEAPKAADPKPAAPAPAPAPKPAPIAVPAPQPAAPAKPAQPAPRQQMAPSKP